jgi:hypothetical protein
VKRLYDWLERQNELTLAITILVCALGPLALANLIWWLL